MIISSLSVKPPIHITYIPPEWPLHSPRATVPIKDLDAADKARDQKAIRPAPAFSLAGIWAAIMSYEAMKAAPQFDRHA